MGQGIRGDVWVRVITLVTKPSKIVLVPTEGVTREEGRRHRSKEDTRRGQEVNAAERPGAGGIEAVGEMTATRIQESI